MSRRAGRAWMAYLPMVGVPPGAAVRGGSDAADCNTRVLRWRH